MAEYIAICTAAWWANEADQSRYVAQYTSIGAYCTAVGTATLTAPTVVEILGNDWAAGGYDTTTVICDMVTSSTNTITFTAVGLARHLGKWDTSRYILKVATTSYEWITRGNTKNITIDGLQFELIGLGNYRCIGIMEDLTTRNSVIKNNIFNISYVGSATSYYAAIQCKSSGSDSILYNNIIFSNVTNTQVGINTGYCNPKIYNNTIVNCSKGIDANNPNGGQLKNNLVMDCPIPYEGSFSSADYNAFDIGLDPGTNGIDLSGIASSDIFVDMSAGDFSLKETAIAVRQKGANLWSDFTTDIAGQPRYASPDAWDLGAWHYSGAVVGDPVTITIQNAVVGTMILVLDPADGTPVAAPFSMLSDSIEITYEYFTDTLLELRARKSSFGDPVRYIPLTTYAIVGNRGATFYLSQVEDTVAI
jgi:hypothetical protein